MVNRYSQRLSPIGSILLLLMAGCTSAEIVVPEEAGVHPDADRMTLTIATNKNDAFLELDIVRIVATVYRKDGGEISSGSVTWSGDNALGVETHGPRSADIRLAPGINTIVASFRKLDGSILSASLSIPAQRARALVVLWESDGTVTTILPPANVGFILPKAINDRGEIVGSAEVEAFVKRAWIWSKEGGFRFIGAGSENHMEALDINDHGMVVGFRQIGSVVTGFRWSTAAGFATLGTVNPAIATGVTNSGAAAGIVDFRAVRWDGQGASEELALTPGSKCSGAIAIGSTGYVAGWVGASFEDGWCLYASPVIWSPGGSPQVIRDCSKELDCGYQLTDVNDKGDAVGSGPSGRPFQWTAEHGFRELVGDGTGNAHGMNDHGQIVGAVFYPHALPTVWNRDGASRVLSLPGGRQMGTAHAINNRGDVAGVVK